MKKFTFLSDCFQFRNESDENELLWKEMMENKISITDSSFLNKCDMSKMLDSDDEDDTPENYINESMMSDDSSGAFRSQMGGSSCYFYYTAGFEFIFTENGKSPSLKKEVSQGEGKSTAKKKVKKKISP